MLLQFGSNRVFGINKTIIPYRHVLHFWKPEPDHLDRRIELKRTVRFGPVWPGLTALPFFWTLLFQVSKNLLIPPFNIIFYQF